MRLAPHLRPFVAKAPGGTLALVKGAPAHKALKAIAPLFKDAVARTVRELA